MLTLVEDTSPGVHDTVIAACDPFRYAQLGADPSTPLVLRQLRRGARRTVDRSPLAGTGPAQPVHEHPVGHGRQHHLRADGLCAGRQRAVPCRGRRDRDRLGLSDGHRADQRARRGHTRRCGAHPVLSGSRQRTPSVEPGRPGRLRREGAAQFLLSGAERRMQGSDDFSASAPMRPRRRAGSLPRCGATRRRRGRRLRH